MRCCFAPNVGGELRKTVKHPDTVWSVVFSPDGKAIAVGSGQPRADVKGAAELWDTTRWEQTLAWSGEAGLAASVAFSPDGQCLAAGRYNETVELRDLEGR